MRTNVAVALQHLVLQGATRTQMSNQSQRRKPPFQQKVKVRIGGVLSNVRPQFLKHRCGTF